MPAAALNHLQHLATSIGARGSCTDAERRAHQYCRDVLEDLGYAVHWEPFRSPRSGWLPSALAFGLVLVAELLSLTLDRAALVVSIALVLFSLVSLLLLLSHRRTPLRRLVPRGESQNIWAKAEPHGDLRGTIALVAHADSHRTVFSMASKKRFTLFRRFGQLTAIAVVALLVVFVVELFDPSGTLRLVSLIPAAVVAVSFLLSVWPELTDYVVGANDNASGAAAALALAARVKDEPLAHSAVCIVLTGCEEVGGIGAAALVAAHPELADADYLVVDSISGPETRPHYVRDETLLLPVKSDPGLIEVAARVARENERYGARPARFKAMTDMSPITTAGRRALSFVGLRPHDGMVPDWHQRSDTIERVDAAALETGVDFVWDVVRALDRRNGSR
jgi:hypothetical protein